MTKSRSELAPRSGFHPVIKVPKLIVVFWDLVGTIKKILKDKYKTLVSNVAHQINKKLIIQNIFSYFFVKFH